MRKTSSSSLLGINIEQWIDWLMDTRDCTSDTANNRLSSLRAFLKYLGSRDPSYLYLYQEALLKAPDISTKTGRRDLALMILLYSTAARIDGILDMKVGQLHLAGKKTYLFYSRNTGIYGKMSQPAVDKFLKKYARKSSDDNGIPGYIYRRYVRSPCYT